MEKSTIDKDQEVGSLNNENQACTRVDWLLFILCAILFIFTPLFFLELKNNQWVEGFIPIRMVNAELKFCVLIITVSILVGIVWIRAHLARQFKSPDKKIYFGVVFS